MHAHCRDAADRDFSRRRRSEPREKELEIAASAARNEGKPEHVVAKIAQGKLKDFYAQQCLAEQIHPNKEKFGGETIEKLAAAAGMKLVRFVHWELGKD